MFDRRFQMGVRVAGIFAIAVSLVAIGATMPATHSHVAYAQSDACPDEITIGWTPPDITGVFQTATDYFEQSAAAAREAGINVEVISRSSPTHTAFGDQVAIVEDFIAQDVDAIAISPIEVQVVRPALERANEEGIPVIVVNLLEAIEGVETASRIGFSNVDGGRVSAYAVLDYFGGPGVLGEGRQVDVEPSRWLDLGWWQDLYSDVDPAEADIHGKVAIIEGIAGGFFANARQDGFEEVIDPFRGPDGIQFLAREPADWNREKAVGVMEDYLSRYEAGEIDAVWAQSNEMGLGAMIAAERADRLEQAGNLERGDGNVAVFTNDVTPESVQRMSEGKLIAETHHGFAEWGWFGTAFGVSTACGVEVPETFDIHPRTMYQGNTGQFYPFEPGESLPTLPWSELQAGENPWEGLLNEYFPSN